ncbi:hypothetical protein FOC1_g10014578 [Fusarium oxysporum f. sp. cubense race 1]|uniref:Uncharacterized protein n=1 Tax=Fusarium oxysporum f. sp. cubense (strain race 1) TaxID=1229664 RepID=N4U0S8_FUSC1|nr:hypothetical protein FOC1_g10014578 [Fusarium oxysporum f. sp. cubense race 1]
MLQKSTLTAQVLYFPPNQNYSTSSAKSRSMAMPVEVIVAIVGVLVNVPTFILVFWHCFRRRSSSNSGRSKGTFYFHLHFLLS